MTANALTVIARKGKEVRAVTLIDRLTLLLSLSEDSSHDAVLGRRWPDAEAAHLHVEMIASDWDMWDFTIRGEPMQRTLSGEEILMLESLVIKHRKFTPDGYVTNLLLGVA